MKASYTTEQAALLATQLERLATGGPHQVAGQFANLEFWLDEAVHALAVIAGYPRRFHALRDAQQHWVSAHHTTTLYCAMCNGRCELGPRSPLPPTRTSSSDLDEARRAVQQGCRRLLVRCHRLGLLDAAALSAACDRIGAALEPEDLE
jgi:hypothetical protein